MTEKKQRFLLLCMHTQWKIFWINKPEHSKSKHAHTHKKRLKCYNCVKLLSVNKMQKSSWKYATEIYAKPVNEQSEQALELNSTGEDSNIMNLLQETVSQQKLPGLHAPSHSSMHKISQYLWNLCISSST